MHRSRIPIGARGRVSPQSSPMKTHPLRFIALLVGFVVLASRRARRPSRRQVHVRPRPWRHSRRLGVEEHRQVPHRRRPHRLPRHAHRPRRAHAPQQHRRRSADPHQRCGEPDPVRGSARRGAHRPQLRRHGDHGRHRPHSRAHPACRVSRRRRARRWHVDLGSVWRQQPAGSRAVQGRLHASALGQARRARRRTASSSRSSASISPSRTRIPPRWHCR